MGENSEKSISKHFVPFKNDVYYIICLTKVLLNRLQDSSFPLFYGTCE